MRRLEAKVREHSMASIDDPNPIQPENIVGTNDPSPAPSFRGSMLFPRAGASGISWWTWEGVFRLVKLSLLAFSRFT